MTLGDLDKQGNLSNFYTDSFKCIKPHSPYGAAQGRDKYNGR